DRGVDGEHLGQTGNAEDLENALLGADQPQRALVRAYSLEAADEHAEPGRVEEVDVLHVDDQVVVAARHEVDELFAQLRGGVDVDLAADRHDSTVALSPRRQG